MSIGLQPLEILIAEYYIHETEYSTAIMIVNGIFY